MDSNTIFIGNLEEIRIPEIIHNLSRKKETGTLLIQREAREKTLYFDEGKIVFSASNDPDDRLGVLLLRRNKVTYRQLLECAPKVDPGKRLGAVLVVEGIIQPNDLYQGVIDQIKEIIYGVFDWETGKFQFQSGPLPQKEVITLNLSTPDLIITGMNRIWRWSWMRNALPALDTVYRKCEGWSPVVRKMTMTREMEAILDLFDRPRTLEEVLQVSSLGNFETCRLIWSFLILAIIEEILVAPVWSESQGSLIASSSPGEAASTATPEMPAALSRDVSPESLEGPTLKLQMAESSSLSQAIAQSEPAQELEEILAEPMPFSELSFSDLAELTDAGDDTTEAIQEQPSEQPWEIQIQPELKQFNELHRYIYEMISLELGQGTNAFLSKIFRKVSTKHPLVFESVSINDFGDLDESILLANIQGNLAQDYQKALDYLIAEEQSMIRSFFERKWADAIDAGLKRILERRKRAAI